MTWFKKHLNWTLAFALVISIVLTIVCLYNISGNGDFNTTSVVLLPVVVILIIISEIWYLLLKKRSLFFLFLNLAYLIGFIILFTLDNNTNKPQSGKKIIVKRVRYADHNPDIVESHCAAFLTKSGKVIIINKSGGWPYYNVNEVIRAVKNIMKGNAQYGSFMALPGIISWETNYFDDNLVNLARNGEIINWVVIENIPDSLEELSKFAGKVLNEPII